MVEHYIAFIFTFFSSSLSVVIIILESRHLHTDDFFDIHELHPELKSGLTPNDKCWKNESFSIEEKCDLCTGAQYIFYLQAAVTCMDWMGTGSHHIFGSYIKPIPITADYAQHIGLSPPIILTFRRPCISMVSQYLSPRQIKLRSRTLSTKL